MSSPILVGITGGIGSGKTTVCRIFESLGISVYYADDHAKNLMETDLQLVEKVKNIFGEESYQQGNLNRQHIAAKAFQDKGLLTKLNEAVHPAVKSDFEKWVSEHAAEKFLLKEAALLIETGSYKDLDKLIVVTSDEQLRIERVLKRDPHRKKEDVEKIIREQLSDADKTSKADFIVKNDAENSLIRQAMDIYNSI